MIKCIWPSRDPTNWPILWGWCLGDLTLKTCSINESQSSPKSWSHGDKAAVVLATKALVGPRQHISLTPEQRHGMFRWVWRVSIKKPHQSLTKTHLSRLRSGTGLGRRLKNKPNLNAKCHLMPMSLGHRTNLYSLWCYMFWILLYLYFVQSDNCHT